MTDMYAAQTLIAPKKYVQGRALLSSLGKYVEELGKDALDAMIAADAYGRAFREAARAREYATR